MRKENKRNPMTEVISKPAERLSLNSLSFPNLPDLLYPRDLARACQEIFSGEGVIASDHLLLRSSTRFQN